MPRTIAVSVVALLVTFGAFSAPPLGGAPKPAAVDARRAIARAAELAAQGDDCGAVELLAAERRRPYPPPLRRDLLRKLAELSPDWADALRHCEARDRVRRLQAAAKEAAPPRVTIEVVSTTGWGCPCPPFALAESRGDTVWPEELLFPNYAEGLVGPRPGAPPGTYRLTGRFRPENRNEFELARERGDWGAPVGEGRALREIPHPVFEVEAWCLVRLAPRLDPEFHEAARAFPRCRKAR